ncbi:MAG: ABC transporter permease subunit [Anaerolineae bacterium]|nr:ABC transporter permease subunit [Anaerolineae bacterium]
MPYSEAARSLGAHPLGILYRHIGRASLPVLATFAAVSFSWALLNGAALAFLGFAGDPNSLSGG